MDVLADLVDWMLALPAIWAYAVILGIAYGENVVPPIPGDMLVVFGGYMAALGQLSLAAVVLLATIGGAGGFMTMYAIGARLGNALLDPERLRWLPKGKLVAARGQLSRWGFGLVAANRFLSGLRSVISLAVGMAHMPVWKTTAYSTLSALVWTALLAVAGYLVGENWEVVGGYLATYGKVIVSLIVAFFLLQFVFYLRTRRSPAGGDV